MATAKPVQAELFGRARAAVDWPRIAPGLVAFAALATIGLADGGLFPRTWRLATIAFFALAAAGLLTRERIVISRLGWTMVAALAAFAGWTALSAAWSPHPAAAALESERTLVYVAAVFAVLVLAERGSLPHLLAGTVGGVTVVAAWALGLYLFTELPLDPFEGRLLHRPIGYANALGIFTAVAVLATIGGAAASARRRAQAAWLAPNLVLAPVLVLTSSRGAWIALVAGLLALLVMHGRALAAVAVVLVALAATLTVVAVGHSLSDFTGEQRRHYWRVALLQYEENPLLGSGAGTFVDYWLRVRPVDSFSRTAHSLYLQVLAELGPLGLMLLVLALAAPLAAGWRRRGDRVIASAVAAYLAYVLHTGVDWAWQLPAATLAGLLCGAGVLAGTSSPGGPALSRGTRLGLVILALGFVAVAAIRLATGGNSPIAS